MTQNEPKTVDLKPNRNLLDPHFDGYKLSLQSLPTHTLQLNSGVDVVSLPADQYSYQHVKAFSQHNALFIDRWDSNQVFYVDEDWKIIQIIVDLDQALKPGEAVWTIPNKDNQKLSPGRHHVCVHFPSKEVALVTDGAGTIYLCRTGNRTEQTAWKVEYSCEVFADPRPLSLLDSVLYTCSENESETTCVEHVVLTVEEEEREERKAKHPFITKLTWVQVKKDGSHPWRESRRRVLQSTCVPDLVTSQSRGQGLFIASESQFRLVSDSDKPEVEAEMETEEAQAEESVEPEPPVYNWSQTDSDVTVVFLLPDATSSADVTVTIMSRHVNVTALERELLNGDLYSAIKSDESTWTLNDGRLELTLTKQSEEAWPELVPGNTAGRHLPDMQQLADLVNSPAFIPPGLEGGTPYNAQELEDVDACQEDTAVLVLFDSNTNTVSHKAFVSSHQFLFSARVHCDQPRALCLRHHVDGVLWQPTNDLYRPWTHAATFNALGYVQASKRDRKFSSCSPDFSYSVIADAVRHVYIYRQETATMTPLRNRKTGQDVNTVARQQLVTLDCTDTILGLAATSERLYLLTRKHLYVVRVNVTEII